MTPATSLPGEERDPALSPNGNQLAFSWDAPVAGSPATRHIYVKQLAEWRVYEDTQTNRRLLGIVGN